MKHKIICGKSETELRQFDDNTLDSCVTDPPYGLEFMGKDWDKFPLRDRGQRLTGNRNPTYARGFGRNVAYGASKESLIAFQQFTYEWATELYRVLKPGAHILVFGGTRTYHRMACAIEDSGFECRDMISWNYGSGFPKSLNISKQLDKMAGAEQKVVGNGHHPTSKDRTGDKSPYQADNNHLDGSFDITAPTTDAAKQWSGWGTGMKPAHEPILLARKSISERNIAANVLKWGVGGINVDGCRIETNGRPLRESKSSASLSCYGDGLNNSQAIGITKEGRFPANCILECCCEEDELVEGEVTGNGHFPKRRTGESLFNLGDEKEQSESYLKEKSVIHTNLNCVCRMLDEQSGELTSGAIKPYKEQGTNYISLFSSKEKTGTFKADKGFASRFFYQAKASQKERWFYCMICKQAYPMKERDKHIHNASEETKYKYLEFHPTQKPLQLIQYLTRLITPPHGTVLDLFMGTGTTLVAAEQEGFNSIGVDSKSEYCRIAERRLKNKLIQLKINQERSTIEKTGF